MKPCIENVEIKDTRYRGTPIPARRLRESLSVGNRARVMLTQDVEGSSDVRVDLVMVSITRSLHTGRYHGRIASGLLNIQHDEIAKGAVIEFGPEHICGWEPS